MKYIYIYKFLTKNLRRSPLSHFHHLCLRRLSCFDLFSDAFVFASCVPRCDHRVWQFLLIVEVRVGPLLCDVLILLGNKVLKFVFALAFSTILTRTSDRVVPLEANLSPNQNCWDTWRLPSWGYGGRPGLDSRCSTFPWGFTRDFESFATSNLDPNGAP